MTDRGGGTSVLPYTPAGVMGSDDDDVLPTPVMVPLDIVDQLQSVV